MSIYIIVEGLQPFLESLLCQLGPLMAIADS